MIKSETEYQSALRNIEADKENETRQRIALADQGLTPEEVEYAMEPSLTFHAQLIEEVHWFENIRRGNLKPIHKLTSLGRQLIALRIAIDMSQKELADRLGVKELQISRDERNEYHGITLERAQRVIDALGVRIVMTTESDKLHTQEPANK